MSLLVAAMWLAVTVYGVAVAEEKAAEGRIVAAKPFYREKGKDAWRDRGRLLGFAPKAPKYEAEAILNGQIVMQDIVPAGQGLFELEWLRPATYTLRVSAEGYETLVVKGLVVRARHDLYVNLEFTRRRAEKAVEGDGPADGDREREADRERNGDREREGDGERDGDREREGDRERDGDREREGDGERDGDREREGDRERHDGDRERDGDAERHDGDREREGDGERDGDREREGDGERHDGDREHEGDGERHDGDREREGDGERHDGDREREGDAERHDGDREREGDAERHDGDREREGDGEHRKTAVNRAREIRGFLVGTIVKVGKDGLVVRISRILTAKRNEAKGSRSLKGKDVPVRFARRPSEKQLGQLQELRRAGGTVAAEVFRLPDRDGLFTQQVKSLGEVERKE